MSRAEVDGLNSGYAALLLEQYLDNPSAVPPEWRALFENPPPELVALHPGLARLIRANGHPQARSAETVTVPDEELIGGVAAAMALVKAFRMHGHLAARLDPLGTEPPGDPALEPERLIPKLTPELQSRIRASTLRLFVGGETLADALPRLRETYCGTIAY